MPIATPEPVETDVFACERLPAAIAKLSLREQAVIRGRFFEERTLEDISEDYGVSRERIRQLERQALWALKQEIDPARALPTSRPTRPSESIFSGALQAVRARNAELRRRA